MDIYLLKETIIMKNLNLNIWREGREFQVVEV